MREKPIGVFDSGVGGLTVLQALRRRLPGRDFFYVADTCRSPYGRKPRDMVAGFAREISTFLVDQGVEAIVVACNTASAAALPQLQEEVDVPVWGVIEPGVEAAVRTTRSGSVGVIATKGAVSSRAYQNRLEARGLKVWAKSCPLFVHLVEERLAEDEEAEVLVRYYLKDRPPIDTLVLGCTHYPLLRDVIQRVVGNEVHLVDSANVTAEWAARELSAGRSKGRVTHFATGDVGAYRHTAEAFGKLEGEVRSLSLEQLESLRQAA